MSDWIKLKNKLTACNLLNKDILLYSPDFGCAKGKLIKLNPLQFEVYGKTIQTKNVTHWAELPESPETV